MLNKARLWVGLIRLYFIKFILWIADTLAGVLGFFPELLCNPVLSHLPIVSFYPDTMRAIDKLKELRDVEHEPLNPRFYVTTLKKGDRYFNNISKLIEAVYQTSSFDEIKFKRTEQHLVSWGTKPVFEGGDYFLELLTNGESKTTIYDIDERFSDIRRKLDWMVRKRLAIIFVIISFAVLIVMLKVN